MSAMTIKPDTAVSLRYTLRDDSGEEIESNRDGDPLTYIHGRGQIVDGLENALAEKTVGFTSAITLAPEEGYGPTQDFLVITLPKERFDFEIQVGQVVQAQSPQGTMPFVVLEVTDEQVVLDGNHPLAGKTLHFDVEVIEVREATPNELEQGHVCHGCGHHDH